jgi:hypothetical protein
MLLLQPCTLMEEEEEEEELHITFVDNIYSNMFKPPPCLFVWVRHCSWLSDDDKISYIPYICLFVWYVIVAFHEVRNFVLL